MLGFVNLYGSSITSTPSHLSCILDSLQYLTLTHPDIAHMVNRISHFMSPSTHTHLINAKRIFRYVKGSLEHGISFRHSSGPPVLCAHSDADWDGCPDTRCTILGFLVLIGLS